MLKFMIGLLAKIAYLAIMVKLAMHQYDKNTDACMLLTVMAIVVAFVVIEHVVNPKNKYGKYRFIF